MKKRRITMFILTMILAVGMVGSSVFAAGPNSHGAPLSDTSRMGAYDAEGNCKEGAKAPKNVAVWHLTKTHRADTYRGITNFEFNIQPVEAWYNDSEKTTENGSKKVTNSIPLTSIAARTDLHTSTATKEQSGNGWKVTLGDYSSNEGQKAGDDTAYARTRGADLSFGTYERAGYYVYTIEEIDGEQAGVTYDKDKYYIVVYVANSVDENDNTVGSATNKNVFVHSITRWANYEDANAFIAANKNLNQNDNEDLGKEKDMGKSDDADGNSTDDSRYDVDGTDTGKEEISKEDTPNEIPVPFDNKEDSNGITVSKNVTGTLGDLTKYFEFTMTLTKLANGAYPVAFTGTGEMMEVKGTNVSYDATGKKIVVANAGKDGTTATVKFKLKDDAKINITGLPVGTQYQVTEAASDHAPSYKINASGKAVVKSVAKKWLDEKGDLALYQKKDGSWAQLTDEVLNDEANYTDGKITIAAIVKKATDKKDAKNNTLTTDTEIVDGCDGTVEIAYTNHRDITTETGIPFFVFPVALAGILALIALAVVRRRKNVATVNDFEF